MFQGLKNKAIRFLLERTCPDVFTIKAMLSKVTQKEMQLKSALWCGTISTESERDERQTANFQKSFKKPLDKPL